MSIESIVPLVEQAVDQSTVGANFSFFSYRHAQEIHALGLKHVFPSDHPAWTQVCASVVVSAAITPKIWVRILWSRPKLEFPIEDCPPWEFPLSEAGARSFALEWPAIRGQLEEATAR